MTRAPALWKCQEVAFTYVQVQGYFRKQMTSAKSVEVEGRRDGFEYGSQRNSAPGVRIDLHKKLISTSTSNNCSASKLDVESSTNICPWQVYLLSCASEDIPWPYPGFRSAFSRASYNLAPKLFCQIWSFEIILSFNHPLP